MRGLILDYYFFLRSALKSNPRLRQYLTRCKQCRIFFLSDPCNAGRRDLGCPFGCQDACRKQRSTERSTAYYRTAAGKKKKQQHNLGRKKSKSSQGNGTNDGNPPESNASNPSAPLTPPNHPPVPTDATNSPDLLQEVKPSSSPQCTTEPIAAQRVKTAEATFDRKNGDDGNPPASVSSHPAPPLTTLPNHPPAPNVATSSPVLLEKTAPSSSPKGATRQVADREVIADKAKIDLKSCSPFDRQSSGSNRAGIDTDSVALEQDTGPVQPEYTFNSEMVEYVRVVTGSIEERKVSREEVLQMLKKIMRQRSLVRERRIDYRIRALSEKPP